MKSRKAQPQQSSDKAPKSFNSTLAYFGGEDPDDMALDSGTEAIRQAGKNLRAKGIDPKTRKPLEK